MNRVQAAIQRLEVLINAPPPLQTKTVTPSAARRRTKTQPWLASGTGRRKYNPPSKQQTYSYHDPEEATTWLIKVENELRAVFSQDHSIWGTWIELKKRRCTHPQTIESARIIARSAVEAFKGESDSEVCLQVSQQSSLSLVRQVLGRFDKAARALGNRSRPGKLPFTIADEYDVQDLLYAILKPLVPDLTTEDPVPKCAGDAGRIDLTSRSLGLAIEVKFAKDKARA